MGSFLRVVFIKEVMLPSGTMTGLILLLVIKVKDSYLFLLNHTQAHCALHQSGLTVRRRNKHNNMYVPGEALNDRHFL